MNPAAIHLVLNNFPLVLNLVGMCLLAAAMTSKNAQASRGALIILLVASTLVFPVFVSGNRSVAVLAGLEAVNTAGVEPHREAALAALIFFVIEALVAIVALIANKRAVAVIVLIFSLAATLSVFYASRLGERIHHPELQIRRRWFTIIVIHAERRPRPLCGL